LKLSYGSTPVDEDVLDFPKSSKLQALDLARYLNLVCRESLLFAKMLKVPRPMDPHTLHSNHVNRSHYHKKSDTTADAEKAPTSISTTTTSSTSAAKVKREEGEGLSVLEVEDGEDGVDGEGEDSNAEKVAEEKEPDYDVAFPRLTSLALPLLHINYVAWILKNYTTLTSLSLGDNEIFV
jgi:hypothetical protein